MALKPTLSWSKNPFSTSGLNAIYGIDDREFISSSSSKDIQLLSQSVALIVSSDLVSGNFLRTTIKGASMQEELKVCADERFSTKTTLPGCTGFMVGKDLMASAGHCFMTEEDCANRKIIFDVDTKKQSSKGYAVFTSNVFECKEIISQQMDGDKDYVVIRLKRAPKNRPALKLNTKGKIADEARVFMIGHPFGMPLMHSKKAAVAGNSSETIFTAGLDSFIGNSGSPVINAKTLEVEGILISGQEDLVSDSVNECYRNAKYEEKEGAEGVFRISGILPFLK